MTRPLAGTWPDSDDRNEDRYRAPALDKGLDILELLAGTDEALSQAEICQGPRPLAQ